MAGESAVTAARGTSVRTTARIAGVFYLLTFVTGSLALVSGGAKVAANLLASASYLGVTLLFYGLFKPVSRGVSLTAALVSLVGIAVGALNVLGLVSIPISDLVLFGIYCLLIGGLILRSTFLPRVLGVLMAIGGLGWLTFVSPALSKQLAPFNMAPGIVGEGALTLWLL